MEAFSFEKKTLPYPGGYDREGNITTDPGEILSTRRALPIGYWKGSGLSLLLDILAASLSGGLSTHEISRQESECALSQVFISVDLRMLVNSESIEKTVRNIINDLKDSVSVDPETAIRYPGENVVKVREENIRNGIPVNREVWQKILSL